MIFLVGLCSVFSTAYSTTKKFFKKDCPVFFTAVCCFFACLVFLFASGFKFEFNLQTLFYSIAFAVFYLTTNLTLVLTLKRGSLAITSLVFTYALMLPTFYGLFFLHENPSVYFYCGLPLLIISIFLISFKKKEKTETATENSKQKKKDFIVWIILLFIGFFANGFCSITQTAQQTALNGKYKNEFMLIASLISLIVMLTASLIIERGKIKSGLKDSFIYGSISGLSNGLLNLFVVICLAYYSASLIFPILSGLNLLLTFLLAKLVFKENYTPTQYLGFVISIISVVLMNL